MRARRSLLPALAALAALTAAPAAGSTAGSTAGTGPSTGSTTPAPGSAVGSAAGSAAGDPLAVSIDSLDPSVVPEQGNVTITGTITNVSDETWTGINLYPLLSAAVPIRTVAELDAAARADVDLVIGERIITVSDTVEELTPGAVASYALRIPGRLLPASEGVHWLAVHALGATTETGRDQFADGKARTFLPRVLDDRPAVRTAVVLQLRRRIVHTPDGRVDLPGRWASDLAVGGRLRSTVELGAAVGSRPLTWLVDPAVLGAVTDLVAGNPGRLPAPPTGEEGPDDEDPDGSEDEAPSPTATDTGSPGPTPTEGSDGLVAVPGQPAVATDPETLTAASLAGQAWLERFGQAVTGKQLLALPYGDVDASAASHLAVDVLDAARTASATAMAALGLPATPAIGSPSGFLNPDVVRVADAATTVLGSTAAVDPGVLDAPTLVEVDGRELVLGSATAVAGGPGPDDPLATVALRQRILSEAAVRALATTRQPLVVVVPNGWTTPDPTEFWTGLDVDWLDLSTLTAITADPAFRPEPLPAEAFTYPGFQRDFELDPANFSAAEDLVEAGRTLQQVVVGQPTLGDTVAGEAYAGTSYWQRPSVNAARIATDRAVRWIGTGLGQVTVEAPPSVTLSSATGQFPATVRNGLDQPVTVVVAAETTSGVEVTVPDPVRLDPGESQRLRLSATSEQVGTHRVRLFVTAADGTPLGSSRSLPVRSNQVSEIIWIVMVVGGGLLVGAIVVRLVRRFGGGRAGGRDGRPAGGEPRGAAAGGPDGPDAPDAPDAPCLVPAGEPGVTGSAGDPPDRPEASAPVPADPTDPAGLEPGDVEATEHRALLASSAVMAAGTVVSRLSGYVRAVLLAWALGNLLHADVFTIANTLPTMLYILLAGGIFNAVLVPQLVRSMRLDSDGGDAYANRVVTVAALFLAVVTVVLVAAAPWVMEVFLSPAYDDPALAAQRESVVDFARYCLPQIFFYGMFALVGQILNARGRFGPMMWAPIANNVIAIGVLVAYLVVYGTASPAEQCAGFTSDQELLLGLGSTLGIAVQLLVLLPFLRAAGFVVRPRLDLRGSGLGHTLRLGLWTVGFVVVNQIAYAVVVRLASGGTAQAQLDGACVAGAALASADGVSPGTGYTIYANSFLIMMVPHAIVTVSLATALLPRLAARAADHDLAGLGRSLTEVLRTALVVVLPFAALVPVVAQDLANAFFGWGAGRDSYALYAPVLTVFGPALVFFTVHYLVLRGFYSLERTRTVFWIQCVIAATNVAAAVLLVSRADPGDTATALALAYLAAYVVGSALSAVVLARRLGGLEVAALVRFGVRTVLGVAVATATALLLHRFGHALLGDRPPALVAGVLLVLVVAVHAAVYTAVARLLRIAEVDALLAAVLGPVRRRRLRARSR